MFPSHMADSLLNKALHELCNVRHDLFGSLPNLLWDDHLSPLLNQVLIPG
jgi:hypothetical protein